MLMIASLKLCKNAYSEFSWFCMSWFSICYAEVSGLMLEHFLILAILRYEMIKLLSGFCKHPKIFTHTMSTIKV